MSYVLYGILGASVFSISVYGYLRYAKNKRSIKN